MSKFILAQCIGAIGVILFLISFQIPYKQIGRGLPCT